VGLRSERVPFTELEEVRALVCDNPLLRTFVQGSVVFSWSFSKMLPVTERKKSQCNLAVP
jgi:hypothetical protein